MQSQAGQIALRIESRGGVLLGDGALPQVFVHDLVPAVKATAETKGSLQQVSASAIPARKDGFQVRLSVVVHAHSHAQAAAVLSQKLLLVPGQLVAIHASPLQRRMRLGHENRHGRRHLGAAQVATADLLHAGGCLDDAHHVLVGFAGQPDHEVQLHALMAAREHAMGGFQDVGFGHVLAHHIPHALGSGFGRKGQARHAQARHRTQEIVVEPIGAQRRNRKRRLVLAQSADGGLHQRRHARVVSRRQRGQRGLIVAALANALHQRIHNRHGVTLTHRSIHHAGLAKTATFGATARDLDRHAIEHRLGVRHRRIVGERKAIDVGHPGAPHGRGCTRIERLGHGHQAGHRIARNPVQTGNVDGKAGRQPRQPFWP